MSSRAELSEALQQIIDHPGRLDFRAVRDEAVTLLQEARNKPTSGPVLQSQVERMAHSAALDRPVLLKHDFLQRDQVNILSIGVFGSFGSEGVRLSPAPTRSSACAMASGGAAGIHRWSRVSRA